MRGSQSNVIQYDQAAQIKNNLNNKNRHYNLNRTTDNGYNDFNKSNEPEDSFNNSNQFNQKAFMNSQQNHATHDLYSDANMTSPNAESRQLSGQKMSKTGNDFTKLPPRSPNKYSSKLIASAQRSQAQ